MEFTKELPCSVMEQKPAWNDRQSSRMFEFERESPSLEVLVVHEDLPAGLRAKEAFSNLENQVETSFLISLCRFGMLEDVELAETALQQAKRADIVFLSWQGDRKLPPAVWNWLLRWLETREFKPCALVVSLDSSDKDSLKSNPTLNFLRDITAPLEVDMFLHLGASPLMTRNRTILVNRHVSVGKSWI
jgi:hypothetical protein